MLTTLVLPLATEGGSPLAVEWAEVIAAIVFALLLTYIIAKYVVPRFEATYHERAEATLREYQEQLADARAEAARIREDAKTQGTQILAEMREQAQAEVARIRASAEANLEAERNQVMTSLRNEIGGLATTLAERIVGETLTDDERARRTVDRFLADLDSSEPEPATRS